MHTRVGDTTKKIPQYIMEAFISIIDIITILYVTKLAKTGHVGTNYTLSHFSVLQHNISGL